MKPARHSDELIQAYFSGKATPQQVQALDAWLREDPSHVQLLVDLALLDGLILHDQKNHDAAAILTALSEAEEPRETGFSILDVPVFDPASIRQEARQMPFNEVLPIAGYLAAKGFQTRAGKIASMAAVLLLGVVLYGTIFGWGDSSNTPTITDNTTSNPITPTIRVVATLTAEHEAVWVRRPGQDFYAGQRFTLIEGFAEITTRRGAVATLQAPATIELIDHENAIRLHRGTLVGRCHSESSRGFVVHTQHAEIIDVGTEFAVKVEPNGAAYVAVLGGEVELREVGTDATYPPQAVRLTTDMAATVDFDGTMSAPQNLPGMIRAQFVTSVQSAGDPVQRYRRTVLDDRPVGYWTFDEIQGGRFHELFDPAFSAQVHGRVTSEPGIIGMAATFTGREGDGCLTLDELPKNWAPGQAYSFEVWARTEQTSHASIVYLRPALGIEFTAATSSAHKPQSVRFGVTAGEGDIFSNDPYTPGRWYHLVGVIDEDGLATLYINGSADQSKRFDITSNGEPGPITIGKHLPHLTNEILARYLTGQVDELAIYDYALTEEQIRRHYQQAQTAGR